MNAMKANDRILKAREVADEFFQGKIRYVKVLEMSKKGLLPCTKIGGTYYYAKDALEDWLKRNMTTPAWQKIK